MKKFFKKIFITMWIIAILTVFIFVWFHFKPLISCPDWYSKHIYRYSRTSITCVNNDKNKMINWQKYVNSIVYSKYLIQYCDTEKCINYDNNGNFNLLFWIKNLIKWIFLWYEPWDITSTVNHNNDWLHEVYKEYKNGILILSWTMNDVFKEWEWFEFNKDWTLLSKINYSKWKYDWDFSYYYKNWNISLEWKYKEWYATWLWIWYDKEWNITNKYDYNKWINFNCPKWFDEIELYKDKILYTKYCENKNGIRSWNYLHFSIYDWTLAVKWQFSNDLKEWEWINYNKWIISSKYNYINDIREWIIEWFYENWELSYQNENWNNNYISYYENWNILEFNKDNKYIKYYENWNIEQEWQFDEFNNYIWNRNKYDENWKLIKSDIYNHWFTVENDNKNIEKMLNENEPKIICENWFSKYRINKTYYNSSIIVCSNNEWIRSWNFLKYNTEWNIIKKWQYNNDKKEWLWIDYENWKEIWYTEYKNWIYDGIYKNYYGSWIYKSWHREWLWIDFYNWKVQQETFYDKWIKNWISTWYFENWSVYEIINYRNWYYHWPYIMYYENWQKSMEWNFKYWNNDWKWIEYYENWKIKEIKYYKEWIENNDTLTDNELTIDNNQNNDLINEFEKISTIIQPCISIDFSKTNDNTNYYKNLWDICSQSYLKLKEQKDDKFWLKEILTDISELLIDYSKIQIKRIDCEPKDYIWDICKILFDQMRKNSDKIDKSYIQLLNVLDNIKKEIPEINIDNYFYIPEIMYINLDHLKLEGTELNNLESEDIELNKSINKIKEYSEIIKPCFWKNIIDPIYSIGIYHNDFENNCKKTLSELENQEDDKFWLKEILINITKLLINYSKIETEIDVCWEDELISDVCEKNFEKEEKIIKKIKEIYIKLFYIFEEIDSNWGLWIYIDDYIYIPYEKIYDENNLTLIIFNIDN